MMKSRLESSHFSYAYCFDDAVAFDWIFFSVQTVYRSICQADVLNMN